MLSDPELQELQTLYNANPTEALLSKMFVEFKKVTAVLFASHCRKLGLYYDYYTRQQYIEDATTSLITMYIRKFPYECPIRTRLYKEVLYILHNRQKQLRDKKHCSLEAYIEANPLLTKKKEEEKDPYTFTSVIAQHAEGKRIVVDLYTATSYKKAILKISTYVDKSYIYRHAKELHTIWQNVHP